MPWEAAAFDVARVPVQIEDAGRAAGQQGTAQGGKAWKGASRATSEQKPHFTCPLLNLWEEGLQEQTVTGAQKLFLLKIAVFAEHPMALGNI